jgi:hypothetical protein
VADRVRPDDERNRPADAGRTSGGGSSGHDQPEPVKREKPARNATGSKDDLVMPADDATLKTKI